MVVNRDELVKPSGDETATIRVNRGFSILIVEDNPHSADLYEYAMKRLASRELGGEIPVRVDHAADGHQAMELLGSKRFHLVLTDLFMPVMDGFALVAKIRADPSLNAMRIAVISRGGPDSEQRVMALGVDAYLRKPVQLDGVVQTMKRLLAIA